MNDSVLLIKGREEEYSQATARRKQKAEAKAASQPPASAAARTAGEEPAVGSACAAAPLSGNAPAVAAASAAAAHVGNTPAMANKPFRRKPDGTTWRLFWVQTGAGGVPVQPLAMEPVEPEFPDLPPPPSPSSIPNIAITAEALAWTPDKLKKDSQKKTWPWRHAPDWPLPDYERYVRNKGNEASSVQIAKDGIKYFFSLLEVQGAKDDIIALFVILYKEKIAAKVFDLPILSTEFHWTRNLCEFAEF
jgi:hypothetical protein